MICPTDANTVTQEQRGQSAQFKNHRMLIYAVEEKLRNANFYLEDLEEMYEEGNMTPQRYNYKTNFISRRLDLAEKEYRQLKQKFDGKCIHEMVDVYKDGYISMSEALTCRKYYCRWCTKVL